MFGNISFFFFSSRRRHTRWNCDWSSDVCSSDLDQKALVQERRANALQTMVILLSMMLLGLLTTLVLYQRRGARHMRALAMTDELTGAPNRRAVLTLLETLLRQEDALPCSI